MRNSFAPARIDRRIRLPSADVLVTSRSHLGADLASDVDQLERLVRIVVERDEADVWVGLRDDVAEEFVARAFGFEPHGVETEQHRLQRVTR